MKAIIRHVAWAIALTVPCAVMVSAQQTPAPTSNGQVLVLDNERVLEGEITRQGELYHIRRDNSELTVPAENALAVCANMQEAYQLLCARANLRDADEHLRLARWCLLHELREQAIADAKIAVAMRPNHAESSQLLAMLDHAVTNAIPSAPPAPQPIAEPMQFLDVSGECMAVFATKVQPILMNTCASCHATGRGGSLVLVRSAEAAGRKSTQQNLTAVIKQICFDDPAASPLLIKACCAHGSAQTAALANREAVPFMTLQGWVELLVVQHPHLRAHGAKAIAQADTVVGPVAPKRGPTQAFAVAAAQTPAAGAVHPSPECRVAETNRGVVPVDKDGTPAATAEAPGTTPQPRDLPILEAAPIENSEGADPFNPGPFNDLYHPKQ
jgi:hypothetical protein